MTNGRNGRPILTLAELRENDPQAPANRCWCPLCGEEKPKDGAHRSLSFDSANGLWNCFRCGAGGTLREFWSENKNTSRLESGQSRKILPVPRSRPTLRSTCATPASAKQAKLVPAALGDQTAASRAAGTPLHLWRAKWDAAVSLTQTPGVQYLAQRGVTIETALLARVRYATDWNSSALDEPEENQTRKRRAMPSVVFPICNQEGQTVAAQARAIEGAAKLTAGPKKEGAFFAPVQMKSGRVFAPLDGSTPVIAITEAPIDALSLAGAGFPAIALCGTSGPNWLHIACGLRRVALALDADEAGEKASGELENLLTPFGAKCERLLPENAKDWNEMLLQVGAAQLGDWLSGRLL